MPYELMKSLDREIWIKVSGEITPHGFRECQDLVELGAEWFNQARVLIVLEDFQGWSKDQEWGSTAFLPDEDIARAAIVGDERWREEVLLFFGKPIRTMDMRFFRTEDLDAAKAWLAQ